MGDSAGLNESGDSGNRGLFGDLSKPDSGAVDGAGGKPAKTADTAKRGNHKRVPTHVDPASASGSSGDASGRTRNGHGTFTSGGSPSKRSGTNRSAAEKKATLEALLLTTHLSLAGLVHAPEMKLDPKEAERLG